MGAQVWVQCGPALVEHEFTPYDSWSRRLWHLPLAAGPIQTMFTLLNVNMSCYVPVMEAYCHRSLYRVNKTFSDYGEHLPHSPSPPTEKK